MKKNDGWMNALFALIFIAVPAIILFYFILPGWTNKKPTFGYDIVWVIAIGFIVYTILFSIILIIFKVLSIESLNFNVPIAFALMGILVTYPLPLWATGVIVISVVLMAFPMNILTTKIKRSLIRNKKIS